MALEVVWTHFAQIKLRKIFEYYKVKASKKIANNIVEELINFSLKLEENPKLGPIEILLESRNKEFRYLVVRHYKIIYWIQPELNHVVIANVFDCRQNPLKMDETR